MTMTRRQFVKNSSVATLASLTASISAKPAFASTKIDLGDSRIDTVSDGHLSLPGSFIFDRMPTDQLLPILTRHGISPEKLTPECNVTLLRNGERTVLFDVGSGPDFTQSAGMLVEMLETLDVFPEDITDIVFTHAHPDHLWGVLDDFDDPLFTNASYMIGKDEWDYWVDPNTVDTIGGARTAFAVGAKRRLQMIEDNITLFADDQEIVPGIAARSTYGHTPGHMSFEVRSGNDSVMIVGDAIGNHHVGFERPEWASGSDQDRELGAATRVKLLDQLASAQMPMIGFHLPDGGIGRVERKDDSYQFVTEV